MRQALFFRIAMDEFYQVCCGNEVDANGLCHGGNAQRNSIIIQKI